MIPWEQRLLRAFFASLCVMLMLGVSKAGAQSQPAPFKPEEIEALVAPIALYPDAVLSQVLMASTYPLEVFYAARWVKAHPELKGDAAVQAVANETWDTSVKSLVAFPQILEPMSDKLDWTQKLGDAVLSQQKDVLAAVQRLRARARESGNLKTNEQQRVIVEQATTPEAVAQTIVRIEPADPEVIYVPAYDPAAVYGGWPYPAYPYYYWPPYPAYYPGWGYGSGIAWGIGLAVAAAIFSNANWGGGDINIDIDRGAHIDHHFDRSKAQGGRWQHNVDHRKGVAYRDNATREHFGKSQPGADQRADFRGREHGSGGHASVADRAGRVEDVGVLEGPGPPDRAGASNQPGTADRARAADRYNEGFGGRDNAFQGVGNGGAAQRDFNRGQASTSSGFNRPSGGGAYGGGRAGGGFRGGRGGGRR